MDENMNTILQIAMHLIIIFLFLKFITKERIGKFIQSVFEGFSYHSRNNPNTLKSIIKNGRHTD